MSTNELVLAAILAPLSFITPVAAQNMPALPDICTAHAAHDMSAMPESMTSMPDMSGTADDHHTHVDDAHAALMNGMDEMNDQMMQGMTAADIDVAFVCSMLPHHLGAISMAKAELAHGDDPWAKELAKTIIDAQTKEVADMMAWLERQPK